MTKSQNLINILKDISPRSISGRDLAATMEITERELRDIVREARLKGVYQIVSGNGYSYVTDRNKVLESLRRHLAHAMSELKVFNAMKRNAEADFSETFEFKEVI